MSLLKPIIIAAVFIIYSVSSFSQNPNHLKITGKWHIRDILYLNGSQGLGIAEYTILRNSVVLINNQAAVEWENRIDKYIWGISKYKDNILVFYKKFGELHMATLDVKSGKVITDKLIYEGSKYNMITVQNDTAGNFVNLLVRTISSPLPVGTKVVTLITLTADGSAKIKEVSSMAIEGSFIGCRPAKDGNIFLAFIANNAIVVELFNLNGILEKKLIQPLTVGQKFSFSAKMATHKYDNNKIIVSLRYENADKDDIFSYFSFNFDNEVINKASEAPLNKESSYKFKNRKYLLPSNIIFTNDKIILVKEVKYQNVQSDARAMSKDFSETAVVSIYDSNLQLLHDIVLEKESGPIADVATDLGCHIYRDKLLAFSAEYGSKGKNGDYCYSIDLNTGKWEKKNIGSIKPSITQPVSPHSTFWFTNECVISHMALDMMTYTSRMEKQRYSDL